MATEDETTPSEDSVPEPDAGHELEAAAAAGDLARVQQLVDAGAGAQDKRRALRAAAARGHLRIAKWLVHTAGASAGDPVALRLAAVNNHFDTVTWLGTRQRTLTAFNLAMNGVTRRGNLPMLKHLLRYGARVNGMTLRAARVAGGEVEAFVRAEYARGRLVRGGGSPAAAQTGAQVRAASSASSVALASSGSSVALAVSAAAAEQDDVPLSEAITIAAHNAYASRACGYWYADQELSIEGLVAAGAHWLSIDSHWDAGAGAAVLRHGSRLVDGLQRADGALLGCAPPRRVEDLLERVAALLRADPALILVIDVEEYVPEGGDEEARTRAAYERAVGPFVLRAPEDNAPRTHWPTLRAMRASGERLVLLSQRFSGGLFHAYYAHTWSTTYGTLRLARQLEPLDTNPPRAPHVLALVPHFPSVPLFVNWTDANTRRLDAMLAAFRVRYPTVVPNAVSLNYVGRGDAAAVVRRHFPGRVVF